MITLLFNAKAAVPRLALAGVLVCLSGLFSFAALAGPSEGRLLGYLTAKIDAEPDNAELYLRRAYSYAEIGHLRDAFADLRRVEKLGHRESADFARGELHRRAGHMEQARHKFSAVLTANPQHFQALIKRAEVLVSLGKPVDALADYRQLFRLRPNAASGYYRQAAQLHVAQGAIDEALVLLDTRMATTGPIPQLQNLAIDIERSRGNYAAAIRRMESLSPATRNSPFWHSEVAELYMEGGDIANAKRHLAIAEELIPQRRHTQAVAEQLYADLQSLNKRIAP